MILALLVSIFFHYIDGFEFLTGLTLTGLLFFILSVRQKKNKDSEELLSIREKLILAQEEIKRLNQRVKELERLDQSKNDFLKILAHDLKSPVNSILGLTEVVKLSEDAGKEEMKELSRKMVNAGRNVKMLIDNLMSWCINNQGRVTPQVEKVSVLEMVKKSHSIYESLAEDKQIDFSVNIEQEIYLKADKDHVFSILRNIINNALKFTHNGGEVIISAVRKGKYGVLMVRDNGIGIEKEKVEELIGQRKKDRKIMHSLVGTGGERGNGLGLTICCDLVALNEGKIAIESVLGEGTLFSVSLPVFN
ncbi:MAG: HAMP domain-containing histidine kinase [Cytophagales bacterium]|nr:HAMP domain-containing histidine kinase [Cytophagales bacterium]